jgi:hypothetical protein
MFCNAVAVGQVQFSNSPLTVTDVSPDKPYGYQGNGQDDPAGRIMSLAIDPTNDSILYAASENAGVWKSVDPPCQHR